MAHTKNFAPPGPLKLSAAHADRTGMNISAIALQGLKQANDQLNSAANEIASPGAISPTGTNSDTVDLSAAVAALLSAKNNFEANLGTMKVADEVQQSTIDLIA